MGTVIFIVAIVVIALIIAKKQNDENTVDTEYTAPVSYGKSQDVNSKLEEQFQELVRIGHQTLVSLEMTKGEKTELMGNVIDSIYENIDPLKGREYVFQIMRKSYASLIDTFHADAEFCRKLSERSESFEKNVKEGTLETYGWSELIDLVEEEKKHIRNLSSTSTKENEYAVSFKIKGLQYREEDEQEAAYGLEEGDSLELEEEPDNEYDPFAIKVMTEEGYHIGYVEASKAKRICTNMSDLIECRVDRVVEYEDLHIYASAIFRK